MADRPPNPDNKLNRGYFGIGIYHPCIQQNIGTLWRSAYQFGASFIFTIGGNYKRQCSDTTRSYRHIPLIRFEDWRTFQSSKFYDCQKIFIEFGENAEHLSKFKHPNRAIYILGSERGGFPPKLLKNNIMVEIPTIRTPSCNVAVSGSIVMYDRLTKKIK